MFNLREYPFSSILWRPLGACGFAFTLIAIQSCSSKDALPTPSNVAVISSDSDGSNVKTNEKQTDGTTELTEDGPVDGELVGPFNNDGPDSLNQDFDASEEVLTSNPESEKSTSPNPLPESSLQPNPDSSTDPTNQPTTNASPAVSPNIPYPIPSKSDSVSFQVPPNFPTFAHFQDSISSNPSRVSLLVKGRSLRLRFLCIYNERTLIPQIEDKNADPNNPGTPLPSALNPSASNLENSGHFRVSGIPSRTEECTGIPYASGQWRITSFQRNEITITAQIRDGLTKTITLSNRTFVPGGLPIRNYHFTKADSTTRSTMREIIFQSDKTSETTSGLDGSLFQRVTCKITSGPNAGKTVIFDSDQSRFHIRSNMLILEHPLRTDIDEEFLVPDPYRPGMNRTERCTAPPFNANSYFVLSEAKTSTGRTLLGLKLINDSWLREIGGDTIGSSRGYYYFEGVGLKD